MAPPGFVIPPQVHVLDSTSQLKALLTIIRNKDTPRSDFVFYADRVIRLLVEEGLSYVPFIPSKVVTPTGSTYEGLGFGGRLCGVSIMRAGEAMEQGLRECCRSIRIGKILIQRDEETALPKYYYSKLPKDISDRFCMLLDPMLATGCSALKAIEVLRNHNVPEDRIIFLNLLSCPEGLKTITSHYPKVRVITGEIDAGLDDKKYIVPGIGDFGCRYFGTD